MILKGKEFKEHESGLFVSMDGEVFVPSNHCKEHFTYGCVNTHGYLQVMRNYKIYKVHRLVAECFLDNPDNLPTVDHINRDKTDNRIENLRWASMSLQIENQHHPKHQRHPKNIKGSKKVLQLTLDGELVKEWPSTKECCRNGYNHVDACCRGERKTHKGYIWKYA